jgi:hypothetical protein
MTKPSPFGPKVWVRIELSGLNRVGVPVPGRDLERGPQLGERDQCTRWEGVELLSGLFIGGDGVHRLEAQPGLRPC